MHHLSCSTNPPWQPQEQLVLTESPSWSALSVQNGGTSIQNRRGVQNGSTGLLCCRNLLLLIWEGDSSIRSISKRSNDRLFYKIFSGKLQLFSFFFFFMNYTFFIEIGQIDIPYHTHCTPSMMSPKNIYLQMLGGGGGEKVGLDFRRRKMTL